MKSIKQFLKWCRSRKPMKFSDLPSWAVVILLGIASMEAAWFSMPLHQVGPDFVYAINDGGPINGLAIVISAILLLCAITVTYFSLVVVRLLEILKERHFE
ncbi:MAG: hypothetical protein COB00_21060 [Alcanivorax sp.]|uniref:hypothetical protein n=1 Tax=Alloalcanivorax xenomutans TaxID=1094342 RepID=UPI000C0EDF59|nr:MAG: hypothetical protein COB00_21060 [Alcanivorax sp.]|tara:strand:+ start:3417 stop:3719 length:303 start_codon:yes stop_codon:yes gene_type:complete